MYNHVKRIFVVWNISYEYVYGSGKYNNKKHQFFVDGDKIITEFKVRVGSYDADTPFRETGKIYNEEIMGEISINLKNYQKPRKFSDLSKNEKLVVIGELVKGITRTSKQTELDNNFSYKFEKIVKMDFYLIW